MPEDRNMHEHPPDEVQECIAEDQVALFTAETQHHLAEAAMRRNDWDTIPDWVGVEVRRDVPEPEPEPEPEPTFYCNSCSITRTGEPVQQTDYMNVCASCAESGIRACPECERRWLLPYATHHAPDGREMCGRCWRTFYAQCYGCHETMDVDDARRFPNIYLCEPCLDSGYYQECGSCGGAYSGEDTRDMGEHGLLCYDCARDLGPVRGVHYELEGEARPTRSFGTEIEVEFGYDEEDVPWELGYYHSQEPAPDCFFSGWRGEYDGSLDGGGEFISPPLTGAGGLAEILSTFSTLRTYDAEIRDTCGQHISVYVGDYTDQTLVQRLSMVLEESLFATTGAYGRMAHNSYAERLKDGAGEYIRDGNAYGSRTCICGIRDYNGTVEFRYPPGTLMAAQGAINVGITQLVVELGVDTLLPREIDELIEHSLELELDDTIPRSERLHRQVMLGLNMFANNGWKKGGEYRGLPYDPKNPPTVDVRDSVNRLASDRITLPDESAILRRLERQVSNFYRRMGAKPEQLVEALKALGISPRPAPVPA